MDTYEIKMSKEPLEDETMSNERFRFNLKQVCKSKEGKLSEKFRKMDQQLAKNKDEIRKEWKKDHIDQAYSNRNYISKYHGKSILVTVKQKVKPDNKDKDFNKISLERSVIYNPNATENHKIDDEVPEEEFFSKIKELLKKFSEKFDKTEEEISEDYLACSGDVETLKLLLEGKRVITWTYLDDIALSKDRNSPEFKALLKEKGKDEINKRIAFLIQAQEDDPEEDE